MKYILQFFITFLPIITVCQTPDSSALFQFENSDPIDYHGSEDEIIKSVEAGLRNNTYIRFGQERINLFGKWCNKNSDSSHWIISRVEYGALLYNCNGISFEQFGKATEHQQGEHFQKPPTLKYNIIDTILEIKVFKQDTLIKTEKYYVIRFNGQEIIFKKVRISLKNKINIGQEPLARWVFGLGGDQTELTLLKKRNHSKTKTLLINRIVGLKWDCTNYSGQVVDLNDSIIIFKSYSTEEADSIYTLRLDSIQEIKYCNRKNLNKYIDKHVKNTSGLLPLLPIKIASGIGIGSLILLGIDDFLNITDDKTDRMLSQITFYTFSSSFLYGMCSIVQFNFKLGFFNLKIRWSIL